MGGELKDQEGRTGDSEEKGKSIAIPALDFGLALMGVVPTLFAVRGMLPFLVAMALSAMIGSTVFLAERARRAKRLDRSFATSVLVLVLLLVGTVAWLSRERPKQASTAKVDIAYRIDPKLENPPPVAGLTLNPGDVVHVVKKSGMWGCDRSGSTDLDLNGLKDPPGDPATFVVPLAPLCSLIVRAGDGNWTSLGGEEEFPVASSGSFYLTANDVSADNCNSGVNYGMGCYQDNSGAISVSIRVDRKFA